MIPIPQRDEDENDDQTFISHSKDKENENLSTFKIIYKSLVLTIIMIILIISFVHKKKVSDKNKEIIPENKNDNNKEKEINDDNKIEENKDKFEEKNEEEKKLENNDEDSIEKEKKDKENISDIEKTDVVKDKTDDVSQKPDNKLTINLSVIINSFNSKNDLISLVKNIISKNIDKFEIIISTNYNFNSNSFHEQEKELKSKNISLKFIECNEKTNTLKIKIDSAIKSNGKYIIFINPEEVLSLDILIITKNILKIT